MKDKQPKKEFLANLRRLKPEELENRKRDLVEELFWLRFKKRSGQLEKPLNIRKVRRELAQVRTIQNEDRTVPAKGAST